MYSSLFNSEPYLISWQTVSKTGIWTFCYQSQDRIYWYKVCNLWFFYCSTLWPISSPLAGSSKNSIRPSLRSFSFLNNYGYITIRWCWRRRIRRLWKVVMVREKSASLGSNLCVHTCGLAMSEGHSRGPTYWLRCCMVYPVMGFTVTSAPPSSSGVRAAPATKYWLQVYPATRTRK